MFPYPQSLSPAASSHLNAQVAFFNDMSKSVSQSFHNVFQLNMQLTQSLIQDSLLAGQRMAGARHPIDALGATAAGAQPAVDRMRVYQQQVEQLVAATHADLARVTEQHGQETARTAHALVEHTAHAAAEETTRNARQQEEAMQSFRDTLEKNVAKASQAAVDKMTTPLKPGDRPGFPAGPARDGTSATPA
jgi:phasin family protein